MGLRRYLPTALPPNALNNLQLLVVTFHLLCAPQVVVGESQLFHGFYGLFESSYSWDFPERRNPVFQKEVDNSIRIRVK